MQLEPKKLFNAEFDCWGYNLLSIEAGLTPADPYRYVRLNGNIRDVLGPDYGDLLGWSLQIVEEEIGVQVKRVDAEWFRNPDIGVIWYALIGGIPEKASRATLAALLAYFKVKTDANAKIASDLLRNDPGLNERRAKYIRGIDRLIEIVAEAEHDASKAADLLSNTLYAKYGRTFRPRGA
jgi:hypothetical protein